VDNSAVRQLQIDKLARLRGERDPGAVEAVLAALARAAGDTTGGHGNLLALAIDAPAPKRRWGKSRWRWRTSTAAIAPRSKAISGVYKQEVGAMNDAVKRVLRSVARFEADEGRAPASWSPRSARTAMTAARRSSPRRSRIRLRR